MDEFLTLVPPEGENVNLLTYSYSGSLVHRGKIASLPKGLIVIFKPDNRCSPELKGISVLEESFRLN